MPSYFPPNYLYPDEIDNDHTLFLVYNTTDTIIATANPAWSDEIDIRPQTPDSPEIWADNGYATISGELLYYDAVEKNQYGKVNKLKRCTRNLGGKQTKYNPANTPIRSFVIAEHHNQLALTAIEIEKFVGTVDCQNENTLTCCLDELITADCQDDNACPDVQFDYNIVSSDSCEGTLIQYDITINGSFNFFQIDFGDGTSSLVPTGGTKRYAPGSVIDPFITVSNDTCEIVVTGIQRSHDNEPDANQTNTPLTLNVPNFTFPEINIPNISLQDVNITIPPIVEQCIDIEPISFGGISIGDIDIPSTISLIAPNLNPISLIAPNLSPISLIVPSISPISVIDTIPDVINIIGSIPTSISITHNIPTTISITSPSISVYWGVPPLLSCVVSVTCPSSSPMAFAARNATGIMNPYTALTDGEIESDSTVNGNTIPQTNWADFIDQDQMKVDYEVGGIPSVIMVEAPNIPNIKVEHDIPSKIELIAPNIPSVIQVMGMFELPPEIKLIAPESIKLELDSANLPSITVDVPDSIKLDCTDIPSVISIQHDIPSIISVVGVPNTIQVTGIPDVLPVRFVVDEPVPVVFKAEPLEMVVKVDMQKLVTDENGEGHTCVALVPCKAK